MQTVTIDLIPQKEKPIVKLSQYDNDRQVRFMLEENGETYTLAGTETVEVNIRKPDRNIVVIAPTIGANAYVDVLFTEQSAACFGESFGELSIKSGETVIGTCNFIIDVEISPIYGGIDSATEINNLETQIEEIISEVLSDDYYTKTETNDLLDAKADASDVYTKTQTDTLLNAKADASDVYTKTQTDTLLDAKANAADVYTKAEVYNKAETYSQSQVDALIAGIFPTKTASGAIASFTTALAMKLVSCNAAEGATTVTRCGVNLWDEEWEVGALNYTTGNTQVNLNNIRSLNYIPISPSTTVYIKTPTGQPIIVCEYNESKTFIASPIYGYGNVTLTTNSDTHFIKFCTIGNPNYGSTYNNDISINYPSTDTTYHAYNGQTVPVSDATTLVTLSGINNVFADSGDVTVQYKDTTL